MRLCERIACESLFSCIHWTYAQSCDTQILEVRSLACPASEPLKGRWCSTIYILPLETVIFYGYMRNAGAVSQFPVSLFFLLVCMNPRGGAHFVCLSRANGRWLCSRSLIFTDITGSLPRASKTPVELLSCLVLFLQVEDGLWIFPERS